MTGESQLGVYLDWRVILSTPGMFAEEQRLRARQWWDELWAAVADLKARYDVPIAACWWQDSIQVEALAAVCNWLLRYDTGRARDPRGKLELLLELERIETLLRSDKSLFAEPIERDAFDAYVDALIADYFRNSPEGD